MAPLQPVGPYQPNPVTLVNRVKGDARRREDPREGQGEPGEEPPAAEAAADEAAPPGTPPGGPPGSHPVHDPLDPDAPGHLLDIKA